MGGERGLGTELRVLAAALRLPSWRLGPPFSPSVAWTGRPRAGSPPSGARTQICGLRPRGPQVWPRRWGQRGRSLGAGDSGTGRAGPGARPGPQKPARGVVRRAPTSTQT